MLTRLTQDLADHLSTCVELGGIPIFDPIRTESADVIFAALDKSLAMGGLAAVPAGETGLAVVIDYVAPEAANPELPGVNLKLKVGVHCLENPLFNPRAAAGQNAEWLALTVASLLVHWSPNKGAWVTLDDRKPMQPTDLSDADGRTAGVGFVLTFQLGHWLAPDIEKVAAPQASWNDETGALTVECATAGAEIWVTTSPSEADGEPALPRRTAATAVRWVAGMTVSEGSVVRVAATAEWYRASDTLRFIAGEEP